MCLIIYHYRSILENITQRKISYLQPLGGKIDVTLRPSQRFKQFSYFCPNQLSGFKLELLRHT